MPFGADASTRLWYELQLEDCIVWLARYQPSGKQCSSKTLLQYASEIRGYSKTWHHAAIGVGAASGRLASICKGVARLVPQPPPLERYGVTPEELAHGFRLRYSDGSATSACWRAALSFGVAALARGCEFALDDSGKEVFTVTEHITPDDVTFFCDEEGVEHAEVRMRKRKDLQMLRGKHAVVVLAGGGQFFDAVRELRAWLRARATLGLPSDGPLFCWPNGASLQVKHVRAAVKDLEVAVGNSASNYGAHSLRIGGATAALAAGVSPALIRLMGRWSSDIYEIYCRMSKQSALHVGRALASAQVTQVHQSFTREELELLPDELEGIRSAAVEDPA